MALRDVLLSTLLFAAGIQATVDDRLYPLRPRKAHFPAKRQLPESMVNVHVVQVSDNEGALKFYPDDLQVELGEMVQFQFHPKNHSIVQSTFDRPCEPMSRSTPGMAGIRSGFMPVEADSEMMPVFTIMVNDTKPMWFYCGQGKHCQNGMVMAINAVAGSNRTVEAYRALAAKADSSPNGGPSNTIPNTGLPSPTGSAAEQTQNAAPKAAAHVAGLSGVLMAVAAIIAGL
ncbi:hypothetical protein D8B26_005523 [Coccidioides posadasii str. Silveira]|uniref:Extracellular serine-rich protein n=1 Tax=Coccidioides posadasii (strain C735) TaxID=222929 RepID=C5P8E5_COCP7|nr:hypothetical protein CPC735_010950 [Coccidioides posadasii C735 delta SOWgp]EER26916.1 hypothetical protein CPC735_010950 [Coccidioides posadasii C735 delta SOWgp]QVM10871.1 hypothetical protein D8B26_005523 [Coccidioides posadasii str. Silveira]|eukprot:XP_003069061.1 hypothetical protein CPC735_010950 [Coccidioides posadasii C735 delta SOWgp]